MGVEIRIVEHGWPEPIDALWRDREALLDTLALLPPGEFSLVADVIAAASTDRRSLAAQRSLSMAARVASITS